MPHPKCQHCSKPSGYGFEKNKPLFCKTHAPDNARDVVHKTCNRQDCDKRPWESRMSIYCRLHDDETICDMIADFIKLMEVIDNTQEPRIIYRYCIDKACSDKKKRAIYGYEPKKQLYCEPHAKEQNDPNLYDVVHALCKVCILEGKKNRAYCGEKDGSPTLCNAHKGDAINLTKRKQCIKCKAVAPCYGIEIGKPTHCATCADRTMMKNVVSDMCIECGKHANYGYPTDKKPIYCAGHAHSHEDAANLVDIASVKCKIEECNTQPTVH